MMTNKFYFKLLMLLGILFTFSACDKDDDIVLPDGKQLKNTELQAVLKTMGFEFDASNKLVMNEKATSTKTLDLSGKKLTSYKGLDIFPALEEVNLANNKFEEFDFDLLPANITKIDLQGNKLYEFLNLKKERKFAKLYLPETAKYNMDEVLAYYTENKDKVDMQVAIGSKLDKYSYLREVPDALLREDLKKMFPSVFNGDKIDLSKEMAVKEAGNGLMLVKGFADPYDKDIKSLEGIQYITGFEKFTGNVMVNMKPELNTSISYFKVPKEISILGLVNVKFDGVINWKDAKKLDYFSAINVKGLQKVDLSFSEAYGIDPKFIEGALLENCPDLEEVIFPKREKQILNAIYLKDIPKLKEIDLSKIGTLLTGMTNEFSGLSQCEITWPVKLTEPEANEKISLKVDKAVSEMSSTKAFVEKFKDILRYKITGQATKSGLKSAFASSGITGNYSGILEPIMNGTTYDDVNSTFTLTETASNKINIYLPPFKVGKMPGKLHIDIKDTEFTTATNGDISFTGSQDPCVYLKIGIFPATEIKGDYNGTIVGDQFHFFIHAQMQVFFWNITADVTFNGTKQ